MKHITVLTFLFLINVSLGFSQEKKSSNSVFVNISNLSSNKGQVLIGLYNSEKSFLGKGYKHIKAPIENKSCKVVFKDVPNGTYAISMFHDENGNNKMDTNFMGIPKEAYGCSNNAKGFMGPPKWKDAKFEVHNKSITQNITL